MYVEQYSIKLIDLPPKGYDPIGSEVFHSSESDIVIGEIKKYDAKKHIAVIGLYGVIDELELPPNAFNIKYIATS